MARQNAAQAGARVTVKDISTMGADVDALSWKIGMEGGVSVS